jgi:glucose/arabinose dehydrogenase
MNPPKTRPRRPTFAILVAATLPFAPAQAQVAAPAAKPVLTGQAAFTDYSGQAPGVRRLITVADLPPPYETPAARNPPKLIPRPDGALPECLPGFKVELYADKLQNPRLIRTAPNGDLFLAESKAGRVKVLRGVGPDGKAREIHEFATGFDRPFGIAFYPLGPNPEWVYVGNTDSVVRFPYRNGDTKARGEREVIVNNVPAGGQLTGGGHWTRDIAFSSDGKKMFVSVGSITNVSDPDENPKEHHRACILQFTPEGKFEKVYASGIRNAVGIAVNPATGQLWASVNERDGLGDHLPPEYITHVEEDGFYGWPYFYMGGFEDPRHKGKHPELKSKVITPDVLVQPHNASLEMVFYTGNQFPGEFHGDIFAAQHGSWNREKRTGYEVIRVPLNDGHATGEYEDFLTGFTTAGGQVWGRPVGVAVGNDGALFVSEDGSNSIWRVTYAGN